MNAKQLKAISDKANTKAEAHKRLMAYLQSRAEEGAVTVRLEEIYNVDQNRLKKLGFEVLTYKYSANMGEYMIISWRQPS